ncbi:MAG: sigma-54-dependent Fis family transcriptional regulator, partial [Leptospiraceae bacterium]|nr:sigma-54-dependent Fis family transcriptional regulator [Leptospiraceae bacterium]
KKYNKSLGKLADDLAQFLRTYHWPANVAQLKNLLEGMVAIASKRTLSLKELPPGFLSDAPLPGGKLQIVPGISLFEYEKNIIEINLQFVDGNREKAAKLLGISERTLYRKIKDLGL